jgi:hypothetical protein
MLNILLLAGICLLVVFLVAEHFSHYPNAGKDE